MKEEDEVEGTRVWVFKKKNRTEGLNMKTEGESKKKTASNEDGVSPTNFHNSLLSSLSFIHSSNLSPFSSSSSSSSSSPFLATPLLPPPLFLISNIFSPPLLLSLILRYSERKHFEAPRILLEISFKFKRKVTPPRRASITKIMIGQSTNFMDEIDCGSFFDHIDDLLDFPSDDIDAALALPSSSSSSATVNNNSFPSIWSTHSESLPCSDSVFSNHSASDLSAELSVPYEDIVQLEWLSNFVEDSFAGGSLTMNKDESLSINKDLPSDHLRQFRTTSPISVLESSSSCSGEKTAPHSPEVVVSGKRGRARSKRPRPATFTPRPAMEAMQQLISPTTSSVTEAPDSCVPHKIPSDSENFAESRLLIKIPKHAVSEHKKKKKIKFTVPQGHAETNENSVPQQAVRKCMHCEVTKTPQWRAGPMGPKTLCNACGVRFKSGRLFPEYRPAASPTFVPSLHSNSHKKVLQMRNKSGEPVAMAGPATMMTNSPELIPNDSNPAMDYM